MTHITFVTSNLNKIQEFNAIMGDDLPYVFDTKNIDLPEYQGDVEEVCREKCRSAVKILKSPVIVEDTSLCFNAFNGLPGVYVKWFLKNIGPEGLHRMLDGWTDKSADAVCMIGYCSGEPDAEIVLFEGRTQGTIVSPRDAKGFGWDSCFQPVDSDKTYAEMPTEEKNKISHRNKAIQKLKDYFSLVNK